MSWQDAFKKTLPFIKNKYVITSIVFCVWVGAFDQNNLIERYQLSSRIKQLEKQKKHYQQEIKENTEKMEELHSNPENLEKFAREQYLMKKTNEDLFVIIEEK